MMKKSWLFLLGIVLLTACQDKKTAEYVIPVAQDETISLTVDRPEKAEAQKLAFIQHGLASNQEHPAVQMAKQAFLNSGYVVITFDSRYSIGKSSGAVDNVRLSTFEEDLNSVINWAKTQKFYAEPFAVAGHSLGGASVLQYAWEHPSSVSEVIAITPVVSGALWEESCMRDMTEFCKQWKKNGAFSYQHNGKQVNIPYRVVEEAKSYNALDNVHKIKAKTLLVEAQNDTVIPLVDAEKLSQHFPMPRYKTLISQSGHNFETPKNQEDLKTALEFFIQH